MATPGIQIRHSKACASRAGRGCNCKPTWQAQAFDSRNNRRITKTCATKTEAVAWREAIRTGIRDGSTPVVVTGTKVLTIGGAVTEWAAAARAGTARKRNREQFAGSSIVAIEQNWKLRLKDVYENRRIDRLSLTELQEFVDGLEADEINPGTIESTVLVLRVVYRRLKTKGLVKIDPTDGIELPMKTSRGQRKPPAPQDAFRLLCAVPETDRAVWATAMLSGLRRGELMGLQWKDVDLDAGTLRVVRNYHPVHGYGPPKSKQGTRTVPVLATLLPYLREHRVTTARVGGLVFGTGEDVPFRSASLQKRADKVWKAAGLQRVTLHACRHLYASLSIAAGVNAHSLSKYMGHSSIAVTFDLYGHLFPGNEAEAATLMDTYLSAVFTG
ncbi:site-specific integrase [Paraconexibacter antarcticus]|uniref:Site-specific integrase n=1 Tax=Paraconexibacter antarcticus TaxID=2949664 RepID=A0ABY5DM38_9ACTN|nr:site-specific integrase [Paraconexibacter antarcticus]UTI62988.1 site-specific integrase [Paraconexibacter antarcticus]